MEDISKNGLEGIRDYRHERFNIALIDKLSEIIRLCMHFLCKWVNIAGSAMVLFLKLTSEEENKREQQAWANKHETHAPFDTY